jgi:prepilin signal peptidase PulO-like enzyme (type II secretory pathway)
MVIVFLVLLGLCMGSFVNALTYRLHKQGAGETDPPKRKQGSGPDYSIVKGRSMCPHCKHELSALDLIPVLSYVGLRGRCRYCRKKIPDTPLPELIMPILFIVSYLYWPHGFTPLGIFNFVCWLYFLVIFVALVIYDLKWMILPNRLVFPGIAVAAIQVVVNTVALKDPKVLLGAAFGALMGGGVFYAIYLLSKGKWIGGGDVKLGILFGLLVGSPMLSFMVIFLASIIGTVLCLPLLLMGKLTKDRQVPFGPLLIAGAVVIYIFGASILQWYQNLVLIAPV